MKSNYKNIVEIAEDILDKSSNKNLLIFANNSVGKTSLSKCITDLKASGELFCYNAFVEECFEWVNDFENDEYYLTINGNDTFINEAVITNGLENRINEVFRSLLDSKIDSNFDIEGNRITKVYFSLTTGDETSVQNIKLSKGEESLFIWSIFCTIIEMALDEKIDETNYEDLDYIIIDDPVTSLEEEKIVSIALYIKEFVMNKIGQIREQNKKVGLLITTHNRLLYNVLFSDLKKENCFRLYKKSNAYELKKQNESPFGYHIEEIKTIYNSINNNDINKIHFNMFRNVLEKMASFIGYSTDWARCLSEGLEDKPKMIRLLNLYSHSRLFDLDDKELNDEEKDLFKKFFMQFLDDYKWSGYNEE